MFRLLRRVTCGPFAASMRRRSGVDVLNGGVDRGTAFTVSIAGAFRDVDRANDGGAVPAVPVNIFANDLARATPRPLPSGDERSPRLCMPLSYCGQAFPGCGERRGIRRATARATLRHDAEDRNETSTSCDRDVRHARVAPCRSGADGAAIRRTRRPNKRCITFRAFRRRSAALSRIRGQSADHRLRRKAQAAQAPFVKSRSPRDRFVVRPDARCRGAIIDARRVRVLRIASA